MARKYYSQRKSYKINTLIERSDVKTKYRKEMSKMVGEWDKVLKEPIFGTQNRKKRVAGIYSKMKKGFGDVSKKEVGLKSNRRIGKHKGFNSTVKQHGDVESRKLMKKYIEAIRLENRLKI